MSDGAEAMAETSLSPVEPGEGRIAPEEAVKAHLKDPPQHLSQCNRTKIANRASISFLRDRGDHRLIPSTRSKSSHTAEPEEQGKMISKVTPPQSIKDLDMDRVRPTGLAGRVARDQLPDQVRSEGVTNLKVTNREVVLAQDILWSPGRVGLGKHLRVKVNSILDRSLQRIPTLNPDSNTTDTESPLIESDGISNRGSLPNH